MPAEPNSTLALIQPQEGQVWQVGSQITCKISSAVTGNSYTVLEVLLTPGEGAPVHVHHLEDESLYVAMGDCTIGDSNVSQVAPTGAVVRFPKGTPHFFCNNGAVPCTLVITAIPGGLDRYFQEVSAALAEKRPVDIAEINKRYQIDFTGA